MKIKDEADIKLTDNVIVDATPADKKKLNKKKRNIIIVSTVVAAILLIVLGWFLVERNVNKWDIKPNEVIIEYGNTYEPNIEDFVDTNKYPNVSNDNTRLEFNIQNEQDKEYPAIGKYEINILHTTEYKLFGKTIHSFENKKIAYLTIVDLTAPTFREDVPKELETYKNCKIEDIKDKFKTDDLSNVEFSLDDSKVDYSAVGEYDAVIIAKDNSNNISSLDIKIKVIEPTISMDSSISELTIGETGTLKVEVKGKDQNVEWTSSDENIARVDNGSVTATGKGTVTITAKANDVIATATINVREKPITTTKPSTTTPTNISKPSTAKPNNNSGTTTQKPQTTIPNTTTPTQTQPYWCGEGGKHHVSEVGDIGWVSTYDIAVEKGRKLISEHGTGGRYLPEQCECGLWTCYVDFY